MQKLLLAFDSGGAAIENAVRESVEAHGLSVTTIHGSGVEDYPALAASACRAFLSSADAHSVILICGTGVGMSIAANKIRGIRAARCTDPYAVERARRSNDANVLALGGEIVGPSLAKALVNIWLAHDFDSERSIPKIRAIRELEERFSQDANP